MIKTSQLPINLKKYRKKAGLTQYELSNVIGVKRSAYAYYEIGKTEPSVAILKKLATIYRISVDELVKDGDNIQSEVNVSSPGPFPDFDDKFYDLTDIEKQIVVKLRVMSRDERNKIIDEILND